jgi:cysteine desulfurase
MIKAMGYSDEEANEVIRLSWCHLTPEMEWEAVAGRILNLR